MTCCPLELRSGESALLCDLGNLASDAPPLKALEHRELLEVDFEGEAFRARNGFHAQSSRAESEFLLAEDLRG